MPPRLLDEDEKLFARQEYRDTYGLIAHVARVYLSYEKGDRMRKTQNILLLHKTGGSSRHEKNHAKNCEKNCSVEIIFFEETNAPLLRHQSPRGTGRSAMTIVKWQVIYRHRNREMP